MCGVDTSVQTVRFPHGWCSLEGSTAVVSSGSARGDELALLTPTTDAAAATVTLERLREHVCVVALPIRVTLSTGTFAKSAAAQYSDELLRRADDAVPRERGGSDQGVVWADPAVLSRNPRQSRCNRANWIAVARLADGLQTLAQRSLGAKLSRNQRTSSSSRFRNANHHAQ